MNIPVLEISNLTKKYGAFVAIVGFNLKLQQGTIHGLVGPMVQIETFYSFSASSCLLMAIRMENIFKTENLVLGTS